MFLLWIRSKSLSKSSAARTIMSLRQGGRRRAHVVTPDKRHPKVQWTHTASLTHTYTQSDTHTRATGGAHKLSRQIDPHSPIHCRLHSTETLCVDKQVENTHFTWALDSYYSICEKSEENGNDQAEARFEYYLSSLCPNGNHQVILKLFLIFICTSPDPSEGSVEVPGLHFETWQSGLEAFL